MLLSAVATALLVIALLHQGYVWVGIVLAVAALIVGRLLRVPPLPHIEPQYWGPDPDTPDGRDEDVIEEFRVEADPQLLADLHERLKNTRKFAPSIENAGQSYGMHRELLQDFVDHWRNEYDWPARQIHLNRYPHFKVRIHGLNIHFVHIKPPVSTVGKRTVRLMLLHGWPGSFCEFLDVVPHLQRDEHVAYELVLPSLPGFVFSEATTKPGMSAVHMAVILNALMLRLRLAPYYVQGGDWGAVVAQNMATLYPQHVRGLHSSMPLNTTVRARMLLLLGEVFPWLVVDAAHRSWMYPRKYVYEETGYMHLQSTKPDSIGFALNDSPAGMAAYVLEKFVTWTDLEGNRSPDGRLRRHWDYNRLLDNLMLYWIAGCITSSMRIYAETFQKQKVDYKLERIPIRVPSGVARYSNDIIYMSNYLLKDKFPNIVHSSDIEGGHFAAFQLPEIFANDVMQFIHKVEQLQ